MSSSPYLNWDEYENLKILSNFFIPNGKLGQTWEEAEQSCRNQNNNSHLVSIPDPNTLAKVQIFIQNLKNPIGKIAGYWILAQESSSTGKTQKVCQIVTEFAETRRVSCSDSVDESGAIYIGLCERKLDSKQKQTADSVEVSQPYNVYTCQCKDGFG